MRRALIATSLLLASAYSLPGLAAPSTTVTVSGLVGTSSTFNYSDLQGMAQVTQADTFTSAGSSVTTTFTGPTLLNVLNAAGGITMNPAVKNDVLQTYVVARGTDGYAAVVSSGEILPNFGHKPDLLAIGDNKGTLPGANGVARLTAPGDSAGGRYVSTVNSLVVGHGPTVGSIGGGVTSSFTVGGAVNTAATFNLAALQALTPYQMTVTYMAGSKSVTDTYTGALLWDVLQQAGIVTDPTVKNDILRQAVVAAGSDGYDVDFSAGELSPTFGNEPILVAYADTAGQLGSGGTAGFARLVVPGDSAGGRYVSNLASLTVFDATAVPEPSSLALVLAPLVLVAGSLVRRRGC